jgi:hypothetical protein
VRTPYTAGGGVRSGWMGRERRERRAACFPRAWRIRRARGMGTSQLAHPLSYKRRRSSTKEWGPYGRGAVMRERWMGLAE